MKVITTDKKSNSQVRTDNYEIQKQKFVHRKS